MTAITIDKYRIVYLAAESLSLGHIAEITGVAKSTDVIYLSLNTSGEERRVYIIDLPRPEADRHHRVSTFAEDVALVEMVHNRPFMTAV